MSAIVNFAFEEHLVRVVEREGEPWFVGKDVCGALGISKHRDALATLDEDERASSYTGHPSVGGDQEMTIVSEPGVYRLVFRSRKPEAERFKRWLAHEVLPAIRRTGRYAPDGGQNAPEPAQPGPVADHDAPLEARVGAVRAAERLYGRASARAVWRALGLPDVPDPVPVEAADPETCLTHLLGHAVDGRTVADMIAARDETDLLALGIRVDGDGIWVANAHPAMRAVMAPYPRFWRLLADLPGARVKVMKFGALASRATFVTVSR